jgi:hypothetical protein
VDYFNRYSLETPSIYKARGDFENSKLIESLAEKTQMNDIIIKNILEDQIENYRVNQYVDSKRE